jgi:hypothetical protein
MQEMLIEFGAIKIITVAAGEVCCCYNNGMGESICVYASVHVCACGCVSVYASLYVYIHSYYLDHTLYILHRSYSPTPKEMHSSSTRAAAAVATAVRRARMAAPIWCRYVCSMWMCAVCVSSMCINNPFTYVIMHIHTHSLYLHRSSCCSH